MVVVGGGGGSCVLSSVVHNPFVDELQIIYFFLMACLYGGAKRVITWPKYMGTVGAFCFFSKLVFVL